MKVNIKNHWAETLILSVSLVLHSVFLFFNPGISYNDPSVYPQEMRDAYSDDIIRYGGYDGVNYGKAAEQLVSKGFLGFVSDKPNAYVTPGQPLYLASNIFISDALGLDYITFTKFLNMMLSVSTSLILYFIGKRLFNNWVGLIAGLSYALYFPPIHFFRSLLSETPALFLFCLSILMVSLVFKEDKTKYHILFSVIFSATLMFRPAVAPLVIVPIIAVLFKFGVKRSFAIAKLWLVGPLLIIAPWVLRNAVVLHEFILFSTQQNPFFAGSMPFYVEDYNQINQQMMESGLSPSEFAKIRIKEGLDRNPILWISWYTIGKTMYLFRRPSGWTDYWVKYSEYTSVFYSYHFLLILFAIMAVVILWKYREIRSLFVSVVIYICVSNIFVVDERYGFFIMPLVIIIASAGITYVFSEFIKKKSSID